MRSTGAPDRMHPAGMAFPSCLALAGNLGRPSLWGHLSFPSWEWAPREEGRGQVKGCPGHRAGAASALPAFLSPLCFPFPPTTPLCRTPPTPKAPPQAVLTKGWGPEAAGWPLPGSQSFRRLSVAGGCAHPSVTVSIFL